MKRDAVTISIVVICIAALIYFIYGTVRLMGKETPVNTIEESTPATPEASGDYQFDDEGDIMEDSAAIISDDLDDDQLSEDYGQEEENSDVYDEEAGLTATKDEEDFSSAKVGEFLVLAGAFRIKQNAENQARTIRNYDCCADAEVSMFNRGAFATVLVDRFDSRTEANKLVELLKSQHNVEAYVHQKR